MLGLPRASAGLAGRSGNNQAASYRVAVQLLTFFSWAQRLVGAASQLQGV